MRLPVRGLAEIERNRATSPFLLLGLARYGFLSGTGAGAGTDVLACVAIKRVAGTAGFLSCLGFLGSRLLRCRPLGI